MGEYFSFFFFCILSYQNSARKWFSHQDKCLPASQKQSQRNRSHLKQPNGVHKQQRSRAWEPYDKLRVMRLGFPDKIIGINIIILKVNLRYLNIWWITLKMLAWWLSDFKNHITLLRIKMNVPAPFSGMFSALRPKQWINEGWFEALVQPAPYFTPQFSSIQNTIESSPWENRRVSKHSFFFMIEEINKSGINYLAKINYNGCELITVEIDTCIAEGTFIEVNILNYIWSNKERRHEVQCLLSLNINFGLIFFSLMWRKWKGK